MVRTEIEITEKIIKLASLTNGLYDPILLAKVEGAIRALKYCLGAADI